MNSETDRLSRAKAFQLKLSAVNPKAKIDLNSYTGVDKPVRTWCGVKKHAWRVAAYSGSLLLHNGKCVNCNSDKLRKRLTKPFGTAARQITASSKGLVTLKVYVNGDKCVPSIFECNRGHGAFEKRFKNAVYEGTHACPECAAHSGMSVPKGPLFRRLSELYTKHRDGEELKYDTKGKRNTRLMMREFIRSIFKDAPVRLLSMPGEGAEMKEMMAAGLNIDMANSLGVEHHKKHAWVLNKLFFKLGWDMPVIWDNIDEMMSNMEFNRYNVIHADYEGKMTERRVLSIDHMLSVSEPGTLVFITASENARGKGVTVECADKFPTKHGKQIMHESYKNRKGNYMHVWGILV